MYRPSTGVRNSWKAEEVVVAIDATTGKTLWEYRYPTSLETMNFSRGAGPHSTPLLAGNRLFAASTDKQFFALDKITGKLLWSHSFVKEYNALPNQMRWAVKPGYSTSPIAYKDMIIAAVGAPDRGVMAFRQDDGRAVWSAGNFSDIAPASPLIITLDGEEQLIITSGDGVHGFDPKTGKQIWEYLFPTRAGVNISSPVWCPRRPAPVCLLRIRWRFTGDPTDEVGRTYRGKRALVQQQNESSFWKRAADRRLLFWQQR
jgi:outer membrane protein assembly factor BamB